MDGHLVEPLDLDVDATSQKKNKKKQTGSEQSSRKRPRSGSDPKDGNEGNLPSAVETSWKGKERVTEFLHLPDVDTNVDIAAEERRTLKIGVEASRLEMDPPLPTPQDKLPIEATITYLSMTTILSNILEHHGRANQRLASLEEDLVHSKREEEEKLKATIEALEKDKREMNARVALMERKDLYELLEAKMECFQIANHPRMIGGFENLNLTITRKWVEIPRHCTLQNEVDRKGIDVCYSSLLDALKVVVGTLPNSLAVFEYMRSIFDSYVNPTNDPNVQPLVKGLDADDFSMDKFFGLQDPTSLDDVQVSPDFEEDLRTNERLRLRAEVRNLGAEPQWLTRSIFLATVLDCAGSNICGSHSIHVVPENEGSEDQGWPRKEDFTKANLESAMYKGRYLRGDVINMYINERFLKKPCEQLHNMFYVNTFWFTIASELVARYDKTNHAEEAMIKITRLWKSICPEFRNEDMQGNLLAWIFMPIHGNNHWSLAIIRIHNDVAMPAHLDNFRGPMIQRQYSRLEDRLMSHHAH
ncbi:hypothetical protein R1flu_012868 [Riccia fluitans]|uniref:Ubiquitin-like protease family profile domain-containing protein n=1 Tax=Riccia fluitans TaxID=41844 RepID=A0ABD1ZBZ7_9MARC